MVGSMLHGGFKNLQVDSPQEVPQHIAVAGAGTSDVCVDHSLKDAVPPVLPAALDIPAEAVGDQEAAAMDGTPLSKEAVAIILEAVRAGVKAPSVAEALDVGYEAFGKIAATAAAKEGVNSFLAGKKPDFGGM